MSTSHPKIPSAPQPIKICFDPYNSSATGHQRAENRLSGSTGWRDSRTYKLSHQFKDVSGRGGSKHLSDLVGAGSEDWGKDGRKANGDLEKGAPQLRERGCQDIRSLLQGSRKRSSEVAQLDSDSVPSKQQRFGRRREDAAIHDKPLSSRDRSSEDVRHSITSDVECASAAPPPPQIFRGLTMYLNGNTGPLISDHKIRQLWASHGGNSTISFGRRSVTHVILGEVGGGLAASKIQKENATVRGKSVKFITARWVLDSVKKGIRQPEGKYQPSSVSSRIGGSGQRSIATMVRKSAKEA